MVLCASETIMDKAFGAPYMLFYYNDKALQEYRQFTFLKKIMSI